MGRNTADANHSNRHEPVLASLTRPTTLATQARSALRLAMRKRDLVAGEFYSEIRIANTLQISRTPVREALIELEREGLIEIVPQRGFRLRTIDENQRREVYELRGLIEAFAVKRLAERATDEDVRLLREILERQRKVARDSSAFLEIDEEFHLTIPALVQLERTREVLSTLRGIMWIAGLSAIARPERANGVLAEHREVVDRIARHDPEGAAKAVIAHISTSARAAETGPGFRIGRSQTPRRRAAS